MTLDGLRPLADRLIAPLVTSVRRVGLSPNSVSVLAVIVAAIAGGAFYLAGRAPAAYLAGAVLVFMTGVLDLIDGALARELETASPAGDLLDHVLDRYADVAIIAGLAAGVGAYAIGFMAVTGVLLTSYLGTQAAAVGLDRVYGGILGRADRLALVGVTAVVATVTDATAAGLGSIEWLLVVFAVVGHLTALQRFYYAMQDLA